MLKSFLTAIFAVIVSCSAAFGQATILPPGETCFSALAPTSGGVAGTGTGYIGLLGTITGGTGGTSGTYFTALTGGSGSGGTATVTVSGGAVTAVSVVNPGVGYIVGDVLSAASGNIGNVTGFSVPVSSVAINNALAGGTVGFYIPGTQTFKQTWQDSGEVTLNQNPVPLDQNGCAVVYGAGIYRMIVKDSLGNTVWDKLTASTGPSGIFWAGTAGGTGNAITVTDPGFASQDGATIQFRALTNNTGPTTIQVSGGALFPIVKDTSAGPAALSGGEIGTGNTPMITYDATGFEFHLVNPSSSSSGGSGGGSLVPPQGYLNLVGQASGDVIQTGDVTSATTLFYSPYTGSIIPIFNGSSFTNTTFSEMTLALTASGSPASTIQDACVFSNNGVPTLVLGPSWQNVAAGSGARGTGAGTAQLTRLQGIWVNAVSITGYNGLSSYTIPASQCTYVGSVYIDTNAGQITAHRTYGQNRKFGVWNAYNRVPITMMEGDPTANWGYNTNTVRVSNGNTANNITVFTGLPEEQLHATFGNLNQIQNSTNPSASGTAQNGIGYNSTTVQSSSAASQYSLTTSGTPSWLTQAKNFVEMTFQPAIGINVVYPLETSVISNSNVSYFGGGPSAMLLTTQYRG